MNKIVSLLTLVIFMSQTTWAATSNNVSVSNSTATAGSFKDLKEKEVANAKSIHDLESEYKKLCEEKPKAQASGSPEAAQPQQVVNGQVGSGNEVSQSAAQCAAIKSRLKAAKTQDALWKVWAGVATVCLATCTLSFVPMNNRVSKLNNMKYEIDPKEIPKDTKNPILQRWAKADKHDPMDAQGVFDKVNEYGKCENQGEKVDPDKEEAFQEILRQNKSKMKAANMYYPEICTAANAAAAIGDGIASKQLMTAVTALATSAFSAGLTKSLLGAKASGKDWGNAKGCYESAASNRAPAEQGPFGKDQVRRDYGSCMTGIQALLQVAAKIKNAADNKQQAKDSLQQVAALASTQAILNGKSEIAAPMAISGGQNNSSNPIATNSSQSSQGSATNTSATGNPCSFSGSGNFVENTSCALASNTALSPLLNDSSHLRNALENLTGNNADHLFKNLTPENASGLAAGVAAGGMFGGDAVLGDLNKVTDKAIEAGTALASSHEVAPIQYSASHGGSASSSHSEATDPGLDNILSGVMAKLNPGENGEAPAQSVGDELTFGVTERAPASANGGIDTNTKISLFDRVSKRYLLIKTDQHF